MYLYRLEEITTLVTGVKSLSIYIPTGGNYAVSYWRKILQYIYYGLEEITRFSNNVKSYGIYKYISDRRKLRC